MIDPIIVALLAFIGIFGGGAWAYKKGKKDADNANALQEQDDYIDTRKRMDEARRDLGGDDAEWLRERGKSKRDL